MKTLETVLKELGSETKVAIGTNKGSKYLIFCEAGDTKRINAAFEKRRREVKKTIAIQKLRLRNLVMTPPFVDTSAILEEATVMERATAISTARNTLLNATKYCNGYVKPTQRPVLDKYTRASDDYLVLIIEGTECGTFWSEEEQKKAYTA